MEEFVANQQLRMTSFQRICSDHSVLWVIQCCGRSSVVGDPVLWVIQCCGWSSPKFWGGKKIILGEQKYFVWDVAS